MNNLQHFMNQHDDSTMLMLLGLFLILMTLLKTASYFASSAAIIPLRTGIVRDLRTQMYDKVVSLPLGFFSKERKGDIIARMTGEFCMTHDSAFATELYDIKKQAFSRTMCKMLKVNFDHLPEIKKSTEKIGTLTEKAASELGLKAGTAVFGGGGDASLIGVGAGAVSIGDTHVYSGTSGWVSTVVPKSIVDASAMIAAVVGAEEGKYNYFAELETAGKCLEWVKDHLALDEIDIYLEKKNITDSYEKKYTSLYDYMTEVVSGIPAGSNGVIFTPWLHGNRCPFEDPNARGMFFNLSLETGKREMIRAVLEGVCYHLRWFIETEEKKVKTSDKIRFVGGGALSDLTCQILADCTGKTVETVQEPQNAGAMGATVLVAVGLGICNSVEEAKKLQDENGGFVKTMWCGELDCELKMKEEAGMSSRCIPFAQENLGDACPICGKPAKKMILWGVAY